MQTRVTHRIIPGGNNPPTLRRTGFTLIELLIVMAIIALLAMILFPVFSRAREKARQAACLSNLKQIGLCIHQYAEDYDARLPMAYHDSTTNSSWRLDIEPYVKNTQVFACPTNKMNRTISRDNKFPMSYGCTQSPSSLMVNGGSSTQFVIMASPSQGAGNVPWMLPAISNPAQVILITESQDVGRDPTIDTSNLSSSTTWQTNVDRFAANSFWAGHAGGRANYLCVDGHVKAMKAVQTGYPVNMWYPNQTTAAPQVGPVADTGITGSTKPKIMDKLMYADQYWEDRS